MLITRFQHKKLTIDKLHIQPGEICSIVGTNNSGIDLFVEICGGRLTDCSWENLELPENLGIVSFRLQQELFEAELRNDDSDFLGYFDPGTLVSEFIPDYLDHLELIEAFDMIDCLGLGYRQLSSGQSRKLLLLREITGGASTLILQNPYDGLDLRSRKELDRVLLLLAQQHISIVLVLYSFGDIPDCSTRVAQVKDGRMADIVDLRSALSVPAGPPAPLERNGEPFGRSAETGDRAPAETGSRELISLRDGFARYGGNTIFQGLDLTVNSGDHTLIFGPNGCGKSTLLDIISGDNTNCYANDLRIFGRKRGSGESIWELKKYMGLVSPSLHRDHRVSGTSLHIILSGLFDSIGLYKKVRKSDIVQARELLSWLGLAGKEGCAFRKLTFSQQRLVLIARGLIKKPPLLLLDEPTHGLDDHNRMKLLGLLEDIAVNRLSTIVYVSHREDEFRPFFTSRIQLDAYRPTG
jgi:molybdate transport system ATP-binding protein